MKKFDKTTLLLKEELMRFATEYPLDKSNTKQFCSYCRINRKTFYAHFSSMDKLLEEVVQDKKEHLRTHYMEYALIDPNLDIKKMVHFFNLYMIEEQELYNLVFTSKNYKYIFDEIYDFFCTILNPVFNRKLFESEEEMNIVINSFVYALFSPYRYAIKNQISFESEELKKMTLKAFNIHEYINEPELFNKIHNIPIST